MGLLDTIRDKIGSERAYGRPSEKSKVGVDLDEDTKFISESREAIRNAKKGKDEDDFLESTEERNTRRKASTDRYVKKIGSGIDKFNKGVDTFNSFSNKISGGSKGGGGMGLDFGFGGGSGKRGKSDDLGFGDFGNMFGEPSAGRKSSSRKKGGSKRGLVPIYGSGNRIVGYRKGGKGKKRSSRRQAPRSIFDI